MKIISYSRLAYTVAFLLFGIIASLPAAAQVKRGDYFFSGSNGPTTIRGVFGLSTSTSNNQEVLKCRLRNRALQRRADL